MNDQQLGAALLHYYLTELSKQMSMLGSEQHGLRNLDLHTEPLHSRVERLQLNETIVVQENWQDWATIAVSEKKLLEAIQQSCSVVEEEGRLQLLLSYGAPWSMMRTICSMSKRECLQLTPVEERLVQGRPRLPTDEEQKIIIACAKKVALNTGALSLSDFDSSSWLALARLTQPVKLPAVWHYLERNAHVVLDAVWRQYSKSNTK